MSEKNIKVGFVSLGCPKNLIDTELMLYKLSEAGFQVVPEDIDADVVVINTCAFIKEAKQEAIDNILDVAWLKKNRNLKGIVVTGCLVQRFGEEVLKEMDEVDAILGVGGALKIVEAVTAAYNGEKYSYIPNPDDIPLEGSRVVTTPEHFAYIKIAEGCDNKCAYCVIPSIRGGFRSRPILDIIEEATDLAEMGIKELCLVAQDTTAYGKDIFGTYALDSLLKELSKIDGIQWIRLLYCYPERITDSLIEEIATNPKVVKYIDMPIQHISDGVLRRMNRRDTSESIKTVIKKIRDRIPDVVLRTTVITGFPGETEKEFNELLAFVKEARFERLGAFEYSREEGTVAYDMAEQVHPKKKKSRRDAIMRAQMKIHSEYNDSLVGKTLTVLCEGYDSAAESYFGRTYADAPDIDGKVYFSSYRRIKDGEMVKVKIAEVLDYDLVGKVVKE
jgi:ribosomal protein S12 methylthiotransferase